MEKKIIYSRRQTLALSLDREGRLLVRAPRGLGSAVIEAFILKKGAWISKQAAQAEARKISRHRFLPGERFWYLGVRYSLSVSPEFFSRLRFDKGFSVSRHRLLSAQREIKEWYRRQAKKYLPLRASQIAERIGLRPKQIRITGALGRWGSCSGRGTVNFSWRLMQAPPEVIDYVIVHELCHLAHHDHSARFWLLVKNCQPGFEGLKKFLAKFSLSPDLLE